MTVFVRLSPSRVEKYLECPARWGFAELPGGVSEPGTEATDFGTEVHAAHDGYYKTRKPRDPTTRAGWVAHCMSKHLPSALPTGGGSELELTYEVEGVTLRGTLDLCWPDFERARSIVRDYKTTGDFKWAKLERESLFGHTQAPLYALMHMRRHGFTSALAGWLYALRPPIGAGPWAPVEVRPSEHVITLNEATERVHLRMLPAAKEMQAFADSGMTAADAHKLPKNLRSCRKYNRWCPYLSKCQPEKDPFRMNPFLQSLEGADAAPSTTPATTTPATGAPDGTTANAVNPPPAGKTDAPAINPPEGGDDGDTAGARKTGKGKTKTATAVTLDDMTIDALADRLCDKLALRLMRGVK